MNEHTRKKLDLITSKEGIPSIRKQESLELNNKLKAAADFFCVYMDTEILPTLKTFEDYLTNKGIPCELAITREYARADDGDLYATWGSEMFAPFYHFRVGHWNHAVVSIKLNEFFDDKTTINLVTAYVCGATHLSKDQACELKNLSNSLIRKISPKAQSDGADWSMRDNLKLSINELKSIRVEMELEKIIRWFCEVEFEKNRLAPGWRGLNGE